MPAHGLWQAYCDERKSKIGAKSAPVTQARLTLGLRLKELVLFRACFKNFIARRRSRCTWVVRHAARAFPNLSMSSQDKFKKKRCKELSYSHKTNYKTYATDVCLETVSDKLGLISSPSLRRFASHPCSSCKTSPCLWPLGMARRYGQASRSPRGDLSPNTGLNRSHGPEHGPSHPHSTFYSTDPLTTQSPNLL